MVVSSRQVTQSRLACKLEYEYKAVYKSSGNSINGDNNVERIKHIVLFTKILEVNLFAFAYRLFH